MLDRLDSFLFSAPFLHYALLYLLKETPWNVFPFWAQQAPSASIPSVSLVNSRSDLRWSVFLPASIPSFSNSKSFSFGRRSSRFSIKNYRRPFEKNFLTSPLKSSMG
jgi:hypothetical protein